MLGSSRVVLGGDDHQLGQRGDAGVGGTPLALLRGEHERTAKQRLVDRVHRGEARAHQRRLGQAGGELVGVRVGVRVRVRVRVKVTVTVTVMASLTLTLALVLTSAAMTISACGVAVGLKVKGELSEEEYSPPDARTVTGRPAATASR